MVPETLEGEALRKFRDFEQKMWRILAIELIISAVLLSGFAFLAGPFLPALVTIVVMLVFALLMVVRAGILDKKAQDFHRSLEKPVS